MYDHPLDEQYRQKFLRLKAEKEGKNYVPPTVSSPNAKGLGNNGMSSKT